MTHGLNDFAPTASAIGLSVPRRYVNCRDPIAAKHRSLQHLDLDEPQPIVRQPPLQHKPYLSQAHHRHIHCVRRVKNQREVGVFFQIRHATQVQGESCFCLECS